MTYDINQHYSRVQKLDLPGPVSNYKLEGGWGGLAVRLRLTPGSREWVKARRKWVGGSDIDRARWSAAVKEKVDDESTDD